MILAIKGIASLIFFLFLSGYAILSFKKISTINRKYLFSIITSLWLSWPLIVLINILDLNFQSFHLLILFLFCLLAIFLIDKNDYHLTRIKSYFFYLIFCIILIVVIFAYKYIPVFVHGDAVFQWNGRWAWSLYQNNFQSYGNYPVFWPGLWALIYKSLGTFDNWIFSNLALTIILIVSFLIVFEFKKINFKFFVINFLILIYICASLYNRFFIGYMDGPLTLLYYSCINLIILFVLSKSFEYLFFGALLISLTAITKQQGFILPAIFFVSGILFVKNKILSLKNYFLLSIIASSHFILLTYFYDSNPISFVLDAATGSGKGNQSYLQYLSKAHIQDENTYIYSLIELSKRFNIFLIFIIFTFSFLNIFLLKKNVLFQLGTVFFLFSLISFFYFSKYGSYDERNGWFIMPIIFASFLCFLNYFNFAFLEKLSLKLSFLNLFKINSKKKIKSNTILLYVIVLIFVLGLSFEKLIGFNYTQKFVQEQLGDKELAIKAKKLIEISNDCTKVYSNFHIILYNYHLIKFYNLDQTNSKIIEFGGWDFKDKINKKECKTGQIWILNNSNYPEEFKNLLKTINHKIHHPNLIEVK